MPNLNILQNGVEEKGMHYSSILTVDFHQRFFTYLSHGTPSSKKHFSFEKLTFFTSIFHRESHSPCLWTRRGTCILLDEDNSITIEQCFHYKWYFDDLALILLFTMALARESGSLGSSTLGGPWAPILLIVSTDIWKQCQFCCLNDLSGTIVWVIYCSFLFSRMSTHHDDVDFGRTF